MFQTYTDRNDPTKGRPRVAALRKEMRRRGLTAFLIPRADEYQNEYVPPCAERLVWLTGFGGSAGTAVVTTTKAALFVDGRYTLQAPEQVDTKVFEILQVPKTMPSDWMKQSLPKKAIIGYDPRLHTVRAIERLEKAAQQCGAKLAAQDENPVDVIWKNQPAPPCEPVSLQPLEFAGVTASKKIAAIQKELRKINSDAAVLTLPESIAWLLNIRGHDVPHTPLPLSFAIVPSKGRLELFIEPEKLSSKVRSVLKADVTLRKPTDLPKALASLSGKNVRLDPNTASQWFANELGAVNASIIHGVDPCLLPKSRKNRAEISGSRDAHKRDGVAMCRFLAWLDANAPSSRIDEIKAARKLESLRADTGQLQDISFDTISGTGANGAIVHYRVTTATNAKLEPGTLYLVDSGAQYRDGTTDITRTIAVGQPTAEMKRHYTLVLKGHIAISMARFPKGTRGADLDPFARAPLWEAGLDFDHGTGHGVGSYLSVHEGPQRIAKSGNVELEPGMILSNEPGYYRTGEYGIRIENLVLVTAPKKIKGGERAMMTFETLTLTPYENRLIDLPLLTSDERKWINAYHRRVAREIGPSLKGKEKTWLEQATSPLVNI